jgi:hypothetical protein
MLTFFEKLKTRMNITSNKQFWTIMLVFAMTGMSFVLVRNYIYNFIGMTETTVWWLKIILWLLCVLPCYYLFLLTYGFLFGQFDFFWTRVKKSFGRIPKLFKGRSA